MKCLKCQRTVVIRQAVQTDKKTRKRWVVSTCRACGHPNDLEEFDPQLHHYLKWTWEKDDEA